MKSIRLQFDIEPVAKGRPRFTRNGRVYTPKKTRDFEATIKAMAIQQMADIGAGIFESEALSVNIKFVLPIPASWPKWKVEAAKEPDIAHTTKPDVDNLIKGVKDALNGVAWRDDSQVAHVSAGKFYDYGCGPGIMASIIPLNEIPAVIAKREDFA